MSRTLAGFALALSISALTGCQFAEPSAAIPPETAKKLASMPFDGGTKVTVHGRATMLLHALPGETGMLAFAEVDGSRKFVFSTAPTQAMAKQGFSRYTMHPGEELMITGVLAKNGDTLGEYLAARADTITKLDGSLVFDRAALR
jgi:hypothetical protein